MRMNRRGFLAHAGFAAGGSICCGVPCEQDVRYAQLPEDIQALYRPDFAKALPDLSLEDLIEELCARGVYAEGEFHVGRIRKNAAGDPLKAFGKFLYTESELLLYAMVARLHDRGQ